MKLRTVALIPVVVAAALALASCSPAPAPQASVSETPTSTPSATPTASAERTFALPADCTGLLSAERQQAFADQSLALLGGPGGTYPDYYADPTPEEQAGGISCIWGDEAAPATIVTVSAAPVTASTRGSIVDSLIAQGLNEAVIDDGISYGQLGDQTSAPAVLNIVRDDSWISVIQAIGGETRFNEAVELSADVATQVYRS